MTPTAPNPRTRNPMKPRSTIRPGLLLPVLGLLAAAGCNLIPVSPPDATRYYVLTTPAGKPATTAPAGSHWRVALRPVDVPTFLRGKAMQVRAGGNEIRYAEEARWAEPLEAGLGRVLRESLEGRGEVAHVVFLNRQSSGPAYFRSFSVDQAREQMRASLSFGRDAGIAEQLLALERLLQMGVKELTYCDLDSAVDALEELLLNRESD